jgi:hypothetical protein
MEARMMLNRAICVATEVLREEFGSTIESRLKPQDQLVLWALLHQAGDAAWLPWQAANGPEEVLTIFHNAFEEAYRSLVGGLDFEPQAERPAIAELKLVTLPEPEPAA